MSKTSINIRAARMASAACRRCREVVELGQRERCALNLSSIDRIFRTCPFHKDCGKAHFKGWVTVIRYHLNKERRRKQDED